MKKIIALAVATAISAPAMADLTLGGSARYQIDNSAGADTDTGVNRVLLSVAGSSTAESGLFVSAGATLQLLGAADTNSNVAVRDGNLALTIGNASANVVLGDAESAGVYTDGSGDTFKVASTAAQGRVAGRTNNNVLVNITAVEGLTAQFSTELNTSNNRLVLGYGFGGINASVGFDSADSSSTASDATQLNINTTIADVAVGVSWASEDDAADTTSTAVYASYMGFAVGLENNETTTTDTDNWMANYSVANAGGVDGFTVTVGAAEEDGADTNFGVRFDYAF